MRFVNELREVRLGSRDTMPVVGHERVVGVDARWRGGGVVVQRHVPVDVVATRNGLDEVLVIEQRNDLLRRLAPYLAAPITAMVLTRLFRAKG